MVAVSKLGEAWHCGLHEDLIGNSDPCKVSYVWLFWGSLPRIGKADKRQKENGAEKNKNESAQAKERRRDEN